MLKHLLILIFLTLIPLCLTAQELDTNNIDTVSVDKQYQAYKMSKSPEGAMWRSLAIPGWGQLYNEDYWKVPIVFGAAATMAGLIIYNNNKFNDYEDQLLAATDRNSKIKIDDPANANDEYHLINKNNLTDFELRQLKSNREFYRDNRDLSAFYLLGVYVIAAVDAYVGAHLYDFNVDDDLGFGAKMLNNGTPSFYVSYSF